MCLLPFAAVAPTEWEAASPGARRTLRIGDDRLRGHGTNCGRRWNLVTDLEHDNRGWIAQAVGRARGRFERHAKRPSPGTAATLATLNKSWNMLRVLSSADRSAVCPTFARFESSLPRREIWWWSGGRSEARLTLVKLIQAKPAVTAESKQAIGITIADTTKTPVAVPTTAPVGRIE